MIFNVHGQAFDVWIHRRALRDRPRQQHAVGFKTKVVMKLGRAVLLYDENVAKLGSLLFRTRLGGLVKATFLFVFS